MAAAAQTWLTYCGTAPVPAHLALHWNFDWRLLAAMAAGSVAYACLPGRDRSRDRAFLLLLIALVVLFVSPFCALGAALFSARVVHHVALAFVVAPLLAALWPVALNKVGGSLAQWTAIQAVAFWFWHAPTAYAGALSSDALFWAMQVTIAISAAIWWAKLRRASPAGAVASLLAAMVLMGLLGALLTFVPYAIYAPHHFTTRPWGLPPLEDQQLGGILMWAPGALLYLGTALVILYRGFSRPSAPTGVR